MGSVQGEFCRTLTHILLQNEYAYLYSYSASVVKQYPYPCPQGVVDMRVYLAVYTLKKFNSFYPYATK